MLITLQINKCQTSIVVTWVWHWFETFDVQAKSHPHSGTWWGVVIEPLPWLFAMFQYFGEILPLVESRWFDPQDEVYIMCRSAAGGMENWKPNGVVDVRLNMRLKGQNHVIDYFL